MLPGRYSVQTTMPWVLNVVCGHFSALCRSFISSGFHSNKQFCHCPKWRCLTHTSVEVAKLFKRHCKCFSKTNIIAVRTHLEPSYDFSAVGCFLFIGQLESSKYFRTFPNAFSKSLPAGVRDVSAPPPLHSQVTSHSRSSSGRQAQFQASSQNFAVSLENNWCLAVRLLVCKRHVCKTFAHFLSWPYKKPNHLVCFDLVLFVFTVTWLS